MMNRIARNEAEFCGKVPLHQTNLLQPHGYLLILDQELNILQAGENCIEILGRDVSGIINSNLSDFLLPGTGKEISGSSLREGAVNSHFPLSLISGTRLARIKNQHNYLILEIEKLPVHQNDFNPSSIYQQVRELVISIDAHNKLEEFCNDAIRHLKDFSGFDKIMIYRFDESWNGDVISEIKEEGMDAYLGLKFPASDIPRQARELYKNTAYRLVPDTRYEPVKLHPVINRLTGGFSDLSSSNLRSVASVHLEYLENMKVRASMSTRIVVNGKLWGLIACHHRQPKFLGYEQCSYFELFSDMLSSRIHWILERELLQKRIYFDELLAHILRNVFASRGLWEGLEKSGEAVLKLLTADGVVMISGRQVYSMGTTPSKFNIDDLLIWIESNRIENLYHLPSISAVFEPALDYSETASGMLVLPLHGEKRDYLLAFRKEAKTSTNWGGNPEEAVQFEADGKKYHPRASFGIWQQTVHLTAVPWDEQELLAAENFMNFFRPLMNQKNLWLNY